MPEGVNRFENIFLGGETAGGGVGVTHRERRKLGTNIENLKENKRLRDKVTGKMRKTKKQREKE